jgi:uncharacterized membrane protein
MFQILFCLSEVQKFQSVALHGQFIRIYVTVLTFTNKILRGTAVTHFKSITFKWLCKIHKVTYNKDQGK